MRSRCRFCGYRFKDKDEQICPECLTAREEDISCGQFSDSEHSHERYDDRYSRDRSIFSENDTFKETKNSFAEEELKEEDESKFAKIERQHKNVTNRPQGYIPSQGSGNFNNNQSANIYGNGFQRQTVNQFQRSANGNFTVNGRPVKKNGSGCGTTIIVIVVIIIVINVITAIIGAVAGNHDDDYDDTYEETVNYDYDDYDDEDDYENETGFCSYDTVTETSTTGNITVDQYYYNGYVDEYGSEYDSRIQNYADMTGAGLSENENGYYTVYRIYTSYTCYYESNEYKLSNIVCESYDENDINLSVYNATEDDLNCTQEYDNSSQSFNPILICSPEAKYLKITLTFDKGSDISAEEVEFVIKRDNY